MNTNEKIFKCIDISNEYRKAKAFEVAQEMEIRKIEINTITENLRDFFEFWLDKEYFKEEKNIFWKLFKIIVFPLACIVYIPFTIISFVWNKFTFQNKVNKARKEYEEKIKRIKIDCILNYSIGDTYDFISLWDEKGLPASNYANRDDIGFYENTIIECILKWYNVFKGGDYAEIFCNEITKERQEYMSNAYDSGIRGLQMEPISTVLLREINFRL